VRLGQVHRNCYINAPRVLRPTLQTRTRPDAFLRRPDLGVEGYTESAATGWLAGDERGALGRRSSGGRASRDHDARRPDALHRLGRRDNYQPTNAAFGLLPEAPCASRRKEDRRKARSKVAIAAMAEWARPMAKACSRNRCRDPGDCLDEAVARFLAYLADSGASPARPCARTRATSRSFVSCSSSATATICLARGPQGADDPGFRRTPSQCRARQIARSHESSPRFARSSSTPCVRA
jgi:hypothetical protein